MNTFTSKKLGEVLAFARVGQDTLDKGRAGFTQIISEKQIDSAADECEKLERAIASLAEEEHVATDVESSATETQEKVVRMRDLYIEGNWDEPSEVLEWMGFYTGAALVHWRLLSGAAEAAGDTHLGDMASQAIRFYTSLFSSDEKALQKIGTSQSEQ